VTPPPPFDADYDVDHDDVQRLAWTGYPELPVASYLPLAFDDGARLGAWLDGLLRRLTTGRTDAPTTGATHVAFTHRGLVGLGLDERTRRGFSPAFREGMAGTPHRSWDMGDLDASAPGGWTWGGKDKPVDALLMLFARNRDELDEAVKTTSAAAENAKIRLVTAKPLDAAWPRANGVDDPREHFGFADGLSQPKYRLRHDEPEKRDDREEARLPPGELLLGYPNAAATIVPTPTVSATAFARGLGLRLTPDGERCDLGRGGSYLVFRQLEQDVIGFWEFVERAATSLGSSLEHAAAKMVGRWQNGAPLATVPNQPAHMNVLFPTSGDNFRYVRDDADGSRCPIGAHVRRSNPRDALPGLRERQSLASVQRHRILRRGRPYGAPVAGWPDPTAMLQRTNGQPGDERGLHFLCLNADIEQQFEFIQARWLNDPTFVNGFTNEVDPMIGRTRGGSHFVVPKEPTPCLIAAPDNLRRFVTVRGGEYFFMPSLRALKYLARTDR